MRMLSRPPSSAVPSRSLIIALSMLVGSCATQLPMVPKEPSLAFGQPWLTPLGRTLGPVLEASPGASGFHLLVSGEEGFAARVALVEAAQRALDLQYYIVADDATATRLLAGALRAAQRGVRVRILVDDLNVGDRESDLALIDRHPMIEVRLFNPFAQRGNLGLLRIVELLGNSARLNRRMHNKLWIADGAAAVIGGRNLGDNYFDVARGRGFADLDVLAAGPVVEQMSGSFDRYWNSDSAVPIGALVASGWQPAALPQAWDELVDSAMRLRDSAYAKRLQETAFGRRLRDGRIALTLAPARLLADQPADREFDLRSGVGSDTDTDSDSDSDFASDSSAARVAPTGPIGAIFPVLRAAVEQAERQVIMVSPYLVPGDTTLSVLCGLSARGVRVRILTNSLASTDVPVVHAGYARHRPQMLACGIDLHEMRPTDLDERSGRAGLSSGASLHTKAIVVDDETVFLGSMNLDPRSRRINTEVALKIDSAELGARLAALFDEATTPDAAFRVELADPGDSRSALVWHARDGARALRFDTEPEAGMWRWLTMKLLGALAPEELL